jgi:hypothetical protein
VPSKRREFITSVVAAGGAALVVPGGTEEGADPRRYYVVEVVRSPFAGVLARRSHVRVWDADTGIEQSILRLEMVADAVGGHGQPWAMVRLLRGDADANGNVRTRLEEGFLAGGFAPGVKPRGRS